MVDINAKLENLPIYGQFCRMGKVKLHDRFGQAWPGWFDTGERRFSKCNELRFQFRTRRLGTKVGGTVH